MREGSRTQKHLPPQETPQEKIKRVFEEYKLVIETQMHFNEMLMRYRSLAFTVIPAFGGVAVFVLGKITSIRIAGWLLPILLTVWVGIFLVDFCYYFQMLLGAVKRSEDMEEEIKAMNFSPSFLGVTGHINKKMPARSATWIVILFYAIPFLVGLGLFIYSQVSG